MNLCMQYINGTQQFYLKQKIHYTTHVDMVNLVLPKTWKHQQTRETSSFRRISFSLFVHFEHFFSVYFFPLLNKCVFARNSSNNNQLKHIQQHYYPNTDIFPYFRLNETFLVSSNTTQNIDIFISCFHCSIIKFFCLSQSLGKNYKASTLNNVIQMKTMAEKQQQQHNFGCFKHTHTYVCLPFLLKACDKRNKQITFQ